MTARMPHVRHYILATAGHVDHGKSALVKALTGTDPDRLPEEKARGITIDLGFAHLELPAPGNVDPVAPASFSVGLIDVPGHEDFVRNMVAGVGSVDLALFVVAADDGWMPQSEEHLQILAYLGVTRAVVALTKIDLAPGREAECQAVLRQALQNSPFADAPIVPTSVVTGRGLAELRTVLAAVIDGTPAPRDLGKPRVPVDRVFTIPGAGTVVTGTLTGGTLQRGQTVVVQPADKAARVRNLQSHNAELESATAGMRTAVNLPDLRPRSDAEPDGVARGDVITVAELGGSTDTADVVIEKSARLSGTATPAARPLKDRSRVRVHLGSADVPAVVFMQARELAPGSRVLAQLRFERRVFLCGGDRFIIRDWSEQATLAGGLVLDPDGDRKHWQLKAQRALLEARAAAPEDVVAWVASGLARYEIAPCAGLLAKSRFSAAEIRAALERLASEGEAVLADDLAADAAHWRSWLARAAEAVDLAHRAHPEWVGLPLSDLRSQLSKDLALPGAFEALVPALCCAGFALRGTVIRRITHRAVLPPRLQATGNWLRQALNEKPLEPPSRKDLTREPTAVQALKFLLDTGEAVALGPEQVVSADAYARAVEQVKAFLRQRGQATVSELRQLLGCTRRIMVPLCEKLDEEGITRREGDVRRLGRNP